MLATSERVSPCRARCSPRSVGRVTRSSSSSCSTSMSRGLALGELAARAGRRARPRARSSTVTPVGTGMGLLADAAHGWLPDLARRPRRRRPPGGPRGRSSRPATWTRSRCPCRPGPSGSCLASTYVALARARDALAGRRSTERRSSVYLSWMRMSSPGCSAVGRLDLVAVDVALLVEDAGHLALEPRGRDLDRLVRGLDAVADRGSGSRRWGRSSTCDHQLDFVMPGMKPLCASSRRQIRHRPNLR